MSKTIEQINEELNANIPRSAVSLREGGGGKKFSYLAGHYVIDRLNKVFGPLSWGSSTLELKCVHTGIIKDRYDNDVHCAHYIARVRIVVEAGGKITEHCGTGYGDGSDKTNAGKAHELAAKEAETDALKRAAKNLGMSMGLALYDKDQTNVDDQKEEPKKEAKAKSVAGPTTNADGPNEGAKQADKAASKGNEKAASSNKEDSTRTLQLITATSKVIVAQGKRTVADLKKDLKDKHGVDSKEQLTSEQAAIVLAELQELANKVEASAKA